MSIRLSEEEMRYMALFEILSGVKAQDCIVDDESKKLTFVVKKEFVGISIGRGGSTIKKIKRLVGRDVEVVGYSENPIEFLKILLAPAEINNLTFSEEDGKKIAIVEVRQQDKGLAIGRGGGRIKRAKRLAQRHCGIHNIVVK